MKRPPSVRRRLLWAGILLLFLLWVGLLALGVWWLNSQLLAALHAIYGGRP